MGSRSACQNYDYYLLFQMVLTKYGILLLLFFCSTTTANGTMVMNVKPSLRSESSTSLMTSTILRKVEESDGGGNLESKVHWTKLEEHDEVNDLFPKIATLSVYHIMGTCILHEHSALHRELSIMLPAIGFHDDEDEKIIVVTYLPENMDFSLTPPLQKEDLGGGGNDTTDVDNDESAANQINNQTKLQWPNRGTVVKALNIPPEGWDVSTFLGKCNSITYMQVLDFARQYAMDHPIYQPFSVVRAQNVVLLSSTPDDFVWSTLNEMSNMFGVTFHPVLEPKKVQIVLHTNNLLIPINNSRTEEISRFYTSLTTCLDQRKYARLKTMKELVISAYNYECLKDVIYLPVVSSINGSDGNATANNIKYLKVELTFPTIEYLVKQKQIDKQKTEKSKFNLEDILAACLMLAIIIVGSMSAIFIKAGCCKYKRMKNYSKLKLNRPTAIEIDANEIDDDDGIEFRTRKQRCEDFYSAGPSDLRCSTESNDDDMSPSFHDVEEIAVTTVDNPDVLF